jgi:hypothetical protein
MLCGLDSRRPPVAASESEAIRDIRRIPVPARRAMPSIDRCFLDAVNMFAFLFLCFAGLCPCGHVHGAEKQLRATTSTEASRARE